MRTLIDIGDGDVRALDRIARQRAQSRAALIREAVSAFLAQNYQAQEAGAFGLWGPDGKDGLVYQEEIRQEW
jgi:predicted transcriptional regulator